MKKLFFIALASITLASCQSDKADMARLQAERDSLLTVATERDNTVDLFAESFTEIQANLDSIKVRQGIVTVNALQSPEQNASAVDRINDDIRLINNLMEENRSKIEQLEKQLKNSNYKVNKFEKMIASLNAQLAQKESELSELKGQLANLSTKVEQLNISIDTLTQRNVTKTRIIEAQVDKLNTAFYVMGTSKELQTKGVISKEGGFLGMGKSSKLKSDFENQNFIRVDITKFNTLPINHKKVKVVTSHPPESYKLEMKGDMTESLQITNAEKFWSTSKYLVIIKD